jgi:hypothetical protein
VLQHAVFGLWFCWFVNFSQPQCVAVIEVWLLLLEGSTLLGCHNKEKKKKKKKKCEHELQLHSWQKGNKKSEYTVQQNATI